ncbi:hypothetical protein Q73_03135 [Bacillus coahuilensis m2-6]|uniref:cryptochrome/photolyase family protein n=1 Tax=Bacillus coahuilensis TaxID=408580 RepID=UPI00075007F0|nr:deoxyribodipyrimidine photo-lyase [Bacillus coahuilensis]KUP09286.1 hypothetical protein Q73_03135 [Bacillus coahuilensis m2-6]
MKRIIVLVQQDFRLHDNQALWRASKEGQVLPVFIYDKEVSPFRVGEAKQWWLHHALMDFHSSLREIGCPLIIKEGSITDELTTIVKNVRATAVYWNRVYSPKLFQTLQHVGKALQQQNIHVESFESFLLQSPWAIKNGKGEPYKVFTPYYKSFLKTHVPKVLPTVRTIKAMETDEPSKRIDDLQLLPSISWDQGFYKKWETPTEQAGIAHFKKFFDSKINQYDQDRDYPFQDGTSLLSPYLASGQISVRSMFHTIRAEEKDKFEPFIRQLVWRDFAYSVLFYHPTFAKKSLKENFSKLEWEKDPDPFSKWTRGLTGYPMVDAGMRELWETGYMHNRVRMIVASFLVKHLLQPWQKGADWFLNTLVDADEANNALGWQWIAGTGTDSSPFFRIFNPITQGKKFDPDGEYIKRWVPELRGVPKEYIHDMTEAPSSVLNTAGVELGKNYPYPIVEHKEARQRALERYEKIK